MQEINCPEQGVYSKIEIIKNNIFNNAGLKHCQFHPNIHLQLQLMCREYSATSRCSPLLFMTIPDFP